MYCSAESSALTSACPPSPPTLTGEGHIVSRVHHVWSGVGHVWSRRHPWWREEGSVAMGRGAKVRPHWWRAVHVSSHGRTKGTREVVHAVLRWTMAALWGHPHSRTRMHLTERQSDRETVDGGNTVNTYLGNACGTWQFSLHNSEPLGFAHSCAFPWLRMSLHVVYV